MKKQLLLFVMALLPMLACADSNGSCGVTLSWSYSSESKQLLISGSGEMYDYYNGGKNKTPWYNFRTDIESVEIESGVTYIGEDAFNGCSNVMSLNIPNTVIAIGSLAFNGTRWLDMQTDGIVYAGKVVYGYKGEIPTNSQFTIDEGTIGIADRAFAECNNIVSISMPNSVRHIGKYSFSWCVNLSSITFSNCLATIGDNALSHTAWESNLPEGLVYAGKVVYKYNGIMPEKTNLELEEGTLGIAADAFQLCSGLESIVIPNGTQSIGDRAFYSCSNLSSISIPQSVTSIGHDAFANCTALNSIVLPENLTILKEQMFYYSGLTSIIIPNSVNYIGDRAFEGCKDLATVTIGSGVKGAGYYTFQNCKKLTALTIYGEVGSLGYIPFKGCSNIKELTFGCKTVTSFFSGYTSIEKVSFLDGVDEIGENAFAGCSNLKQIVLSNSIKHIASGAFRGCLQLNTVNLNVGIHSIGKEAFENCGITDFVIPSSTEEIGFHVCGGPNLKKVIIEESEKSLLIDNSSGSEILGTNVVSELYIGRNVSLKSTQNYNYRVFLFNKMECLTSLTIGKYVTFIDPDYFENCQNIESIILEDGTEELGIGELGRSYTPFSKCPISFLYLGRNIKEGSMFSPFQISNPCSVIIGKNVTSFASLLSNCTSINNIRVDTGNTKFDSRDNCNAVIETSTNTLVMGSLNTIIPNSVSTIGDNAFTSCTNLTSIVLPDNIVTISSGAFRNCANLTDINIPINIKTIASSAFEGCNNLTVTFNCSYVESWLQGSTSIKGVVFGDGVVTIGDNALNECRGLTTLIIGKNVRSIYSYAFKNCYKLSSVIIPENITSISTTAFQGCYGLTSITFQCPVVGSWFKDRTTLNHVTFEDGVTSIADMAFSGCTSLASINISSSVNNISNSAFYGCTTMAEINVEAGNSHYDSRNNCNAVIESSSNTLIVGCKNTIIPNDVTSIGSYAFNGCTGLAAMEIPNSVISIGSYAFGDCTNLTSFEIPNNVATIGSYAFQGCSSLSSVIIKDGETPLDYGDGYNFSGCPLKDVYLGRNLKYTVNSPFINNREGITSLSFGNNVTEIGESLFSGFKSLLSVDLPKNLTKIGKLAFYGCEGLSTLTIPSSVTEIGQQAFDLCRGLKTLTFEDGEAVLEFTASPNYVNNAFVNSPLEEIYLGRNIIYQNVSPFFAIESIKKLTLGIKVTRLPDRVFAGLPNLKEVYSYSETVPTTGESVFTESYLPNATLHVPYSLYDEYRVTEPWSKFGNIVNFEGKYNLVYLVDGIEYKKNVIEEGGAIVAESEPTKEGYTFSGWSEIPEIMPAHDVTIIGSFIANKYKLTYQVDGVDYKVYEVDYNTTIIPEVAPTKEGYTFSGWSELPQTMPAKDVVVTGTFNINSYVVTFKADGKVIKSETLTYGATITAPEDPTKEGYTFVGWNPEVDATVPANDVTYEAVYQVNVYAVVYMVNDKEWARDSVAYGETIVLKQYTPAEGETFNSWTSDQEYTTMPAHDVVYTANITTGIWGVIANREFVDVYNLQGGVVARRMPVKDLKKRLPRGVYIIEGRKVVIK